ncbi:L,D-transpeptidase [Neorhizobium sp. T25_13]|uniref:L,D-transpeptidase n=1 Tax=Neorhizobium sp. T25_13 TaxID=2093830 RepID=UPI000CF888A4|nr:L,D-transpeptidase [Neorhizobium sp. T25_13]
MMKKTLFLAFGLAAAFSSSATFAQDRYRERPPVVVSPDLAAPWVMQLAGPNGRPVVYPRQAAQQRTIYQQREQQPMVRRGIFDRSPAQPVAMRPQPIRSRIEPQFLPQTVAYDSKEKAGTIIIDTNNRFLYLVMDNGQARRYGVGVGKPGFEWAGEHRVTRKAEWPDWTPPSEMISREAAKGHYLPARMEGGPENPLGARAMYLGSTLYRIHGTNAPWSIGSAVSSGCIRMRNEDVTDLYGRVNIGTKVVVM